MSIPVVPLVVATALFMETMDSSLIATALPTIARDLGVDPVALKLAVTSYLVSLAILIPVSGWIADRIGACTTFRIALAVFMAASIGCSTASTLAELVVWRFLQGMGGALMVPVGRLVIVRAIPKGELVRAMSFLTMPSLLGPLTGPPLAGFLATYADWRWIFLVNVPVGLAGIVLATLYIDDERRECRPLDAKGFALASVALPGLVLGAALLGRHVAPTWVAVLVLATGLAAAVLYVRHARSTPQPLLDLSLLRVPTFDAGVLGGALFRMGIGASAFLIPLMLQLGFGLDPMTSGLVTLAGALGAFGMKSMAPALIRRLGFRHILVWNGLLAAAALASTALVSAATPLLVVAGLLLVTGLLRSLQFSSLNAISYADIPDDRTSAATSLASVVQQVSLSLGVALAAVVVEVAATWGGRATPAATDFSVAILVVAAVSAGGVIRHLKLDERSGEALRGVTVRSRDDPG